MDKKRPIGQLVVPDGAIDEFQGFLKIGLIERYPSIAGNTIVHMGNPRSRLNIRMGYDNNVEIGASSAFNASLTMWAESRFTIGDHTRCNALQSECRFSTVQVGNHCLLSDGIWIQASDMHAIWDIESGRLVNSQGFGVEIQDYVWLGRNSSIVRPIKVGTGSIIGFGSVVTKDIPSLSVAAGNPAKVIRRGCTWTGLFNEDDFLARIAEIDSAKK
jgi:acetyltransferase-like isoleucine patch superfamily enzyme